jgi:arsenate reductase
VSFQPAQPIRVLFICTGNSCRSQMAEALLRHMGGGRFEAASAGTHPAGYIHPLALDAMRELGVSTEGQHSKSCSDVAGDSHDLVITVCDHAACWPSPAWRGEPARGHWSLPDPSFVSGSPAERLSAALDVARTLQRWLGQLIELPLERLTREERQRQLARIAGTNP